MEDNKFDKYSLSELFKEADKRIVEKNNLELNTLGKTSRMLDKRTNIVADTIMLLILRIFRKADSTKEMIERVDDELGIIAAPGEENSSYEFDDKGLTITLDYSKRMDFDAEKNVKNFADDINWQLLKKILKAYDIDIVREKDDPTLFSMVASGNYSDVITIKVENAATYKIKETAKANTDDTIVINSEFYNQLCNNRVALFRDVAERIQRKIDLEKVEQQTKEYIERIARKKSDELVIVIQNFIWDILSKIGTEYSEREIITEVPEELGVLGNKLGDSRASHFLFTGDTLTITLNYSRNNDADAYSMSFEGNVDWNYLKQQLKEVCGIDIDRQVYSVNADREHPAHNYDIVTIRVYGDVKTYGEGRIY